MKKRKIKELQEKYTVRGGVIGLTLFALIILISLNSQIYLNGNHTFVDLFILFPGLWIALTLPFVLAIIAFFISKPLLNKI